jgi:hypothetical protein
LTFCSVSEFDLSPPTMPNDNSSVDPFNTVPPGGLAIHCNLSKATLKTKIVTQRWTLII